MIAIDLDGAATWVVGGARGIGAAVVRMAAAAGSRVAWTCLDTPEDNRGSEALLRELGGDDGRAHAAHVDCTDEAATRAFVEERMQAWGRMDHLVYCAGLTSPKPMLELDAAQWRACLDINLTGAFIAVRAAVEHMARQRRGSIVLLGSAAIVAGGGGRADYVSAKAAMEGLNRAVTKEFAPQGIRCNLVHPSLIETDLLRKRYPDPAQRASAADGVPLGRLGRPEDVAQATVFLLSGLSSYITGQSIFVDGGRTFCG